MLLRRLRPSFAQLWLLRRLSLEQAGRRGRGWALRVAPGRLSSVRTAKWVGGWWSPRAWSRESGKWLRPSVDFPESPEMPAAQQRGPLEESSDAAAGSSFPADAAP